MKFLEEKFEHTCIELLEQEGRLRNLECVLFDSEKGIRENELMKL